jgi:hypothetical protein
MLRLFTEYYVRRAHIVVISKMTFVEDGRLETNVGSISSGMDATDHHKVLRERSVATVPGLVPNRFSTALFPHLQL